MDCWFAGCLALVALTNVQDDSQQQCAHEPHAVVVSSAVAVGNTSSSPGQ
jgi:hypothetical protein